MSNRASKLTSCLTGAGTPTAVPSKGYQSGTPPLGWLRGARSRTGAKANALQTGFSNNIYHARMMTDVKLSNPIETSRKEMVARENEKERAINMGLQTGSRETSREK